MIRLRHGDATALVAGIELGGVDEAVDVGRVGQVVLQVLERALHSAWEQWVNPHIHTNPRLPYHFNRHDCFR